MSIFVSKESRIIWSAKNKETKIKMVNIICKSKKFTEIEAIIFDKDGTLADSQSYLRELAIKRTRIIDAQIPGIGEPLLMAFGVDNDNIDLTGLMAVASRGENEIVAAGYIAETGRSWFESLAIARKAFDEAEKVLPERGANSIVFDDVKEALKYLSESELKLGILSADSTIGVENFVKTHQLSDYIQLSMGVDNNLTKPNPQLFINACEKLGVKPESTLMVGDSLGDIEMAKAAHAAGIIGISWHNYSSNHLNQADVIISNLKEIKLN